MNTENCALVTGIANPVPFIEHLTNKGFKLPHLKFPDHHGFKDKELDELDRYKSILTTEKDFMRLKDSKLKKKLYYLPIKTVIINEAEEFEACIKNYVNKKEV
jgi:tetraacyldisaccharide 4'-kinase